MRKVLIAIIFLLMCVSPAFAYYHEYIWDAGYSGTMTNNNSVDLVGASVGRHSITFECPHAQGTNYSNCTDDPRFELSVLPTYDTKSGVLNFSTNYSSPVNISMNIVSAKVGGEDIWQYDDDKTVAFHTSFKVSDDTNFEGGEVNIYRDGNSSTGSLVYTGIIENTTDWQYFVWYGWDDSMNEDTTFVAYYFINNWREMPVGTAFYIDDLRFFTVETELASPSPPSLSARRDMCEASAEMGFDECGSNCGAFYDANVSGKVLAGNIHKTLETGGGVFIPCITLFYGGITTSRIPIGDPSHAMYPSGWNEAHLVTWKRWNFHATTQDYKYIWNYYQIGTTPSYWRIHTLLFGFDNTEVVITTFDVEGGWSGIGTIDCDVAGSVPQSVLSGGSLGLWREVIDISSYGCTGTQFQFVDYGANQVNTYYSSSWMDIPFDFAPVCDEGFYCSGNQEYYLLPDCEVTNLEACGVCGCDFEGSGGRCRLETEYVECVNSIRISFYDNCEETDSFLCDIECISVEGDDDYCLGETVCADVGDCPSAVCSGSTRYSDPYCDGGTSSCKYNEEEECEFDCIAGYCTLGEVSPAFDDVTPTGIIQSLKDGIVGFISGFATPFFIFIMVIVVVILITGLFSALFGKLFHR